MLFLGITGGVGAGKSEILSYIRKNFNSRVMLADEIAHDLMEPGTSCNERLQELFAGDAVFDENGVIDRPQMAQVIFTDDEKREALNAIVHPAVKDYIIEQAAKERSEGKTELLVLEAALLIEEDYGAICDELWYIYTSEENRRGRLKTSRGYSDAKVQSIFDSQMPEAVYREHCAVVIDNNKTPAEAFRQVQDALSDRGITPGFSVQQN